MTNAADQTLTDWLYEDVLSTETRASLLATMLRFAADRVSAMVQAVPNLPGESIADLLRAEADGLAGR